MILAALLGTAWPARAHDPAWETRSYYVTDTNTSTLNHLGCETADQGRQGRTTLLFGSPVAVNGTFGATLWSAPNQTTGGVTNLVKQFVRGYHDCAARSIFLRVGVGISNCNIGGASDVNCTLDPGSTWVRDHGEAWGDMVNSIGAWIANNGYGDRVSIYGAWDVEPAWSSYSRADSWMHGYDLDSSSPYSIWANGSADGCPSDTPLNTSTNYSCGNGWTQFRVWHESWDHDPSLPFPQIYLNDGTNARQWMRIDEYGYHAQSQSMHFFGTLSQYAACGGDPSCSSTDNTPHQAHDQLLGELQSHSHTTEADFVYTTDMSWSLHDH